MSYGSISCLCHSYRLHPIDVAILRMDRPECVRSLETLQIQSTGGVSKALGDNLSELIEVKGKRPVSILQGRA